jgi:plastocyanin
LSRTEAEALAYLRASGRDLRKESRMRGLHFGFVAVLVAIALAAVGCGGGDNEGAGTTTTTSETTTTGTETETTTTGGEATKLIGTVGEEGNPDAFTITLTKEDGSDVTTLTPGKYTLEIKDLSSIHNFHLTGPGGVDVSSDVGETEDEDYDVTLEDGTYNYVCDPHASQMNGSFTVSG